MKKITIYTDGACSGNPGPGGWGAVLLYGSHRKEIAGFEPDTTNNRMELMAAIRAVEALKEPCSIDLYTDSSYLCNAFQKRWIEGWIARGWQTAAKKPVENQDLWTALLNAIRTHETAFHKVKGHAENEENNRCDQLAREAIQNAKKAGTV